MQNLTHPFIQYPFFIYSSSIPFQYILFLYTLLFYCSYTYKSSSILLSLSNYLISYDNLWKIMIGYGRFWKIDFAFILPLYTFLILSLPI